MTVCRSRLALALTCGSHTACPARVRTSAPLQELPPRPTDSTTPQGRFHNLLLSHSLPEDFPGAHTPVGS